MKYSTILPMSVILDIDLPITADGLVGQSEAFPESLKTPYTLILVLFHSPKMIEVLETNYNLILY